MPPWLKFYQTITKPLPVASSLFLALSTGFILFAPDAMILKLGMVRVIPDYRWAVGLGFVIATTWLAVTALVWLYHALVGRLARFAAVHRAKERVENEIPQMTLVEREIIACLLARNQRVFTNTTDGGYANTLISKRIVFPALLPGQTFTYYDFPFEIPAPVWSVLRKHKADFPFTPPEAGEDASDPWRVP